MIEPLEDIADLLIGVPLLQRRRLKEALFSTYIAHPFLFDRTCPPLVCVWILKAPLS